ncbi:hypothetical protein M758_UG196100 [Ceratodon purpureus]|nr:hypothetical protein M758_UG196100 [Ceratodon purpureus]
MYVLLPIGVLVFFGSSRVGSSETFSASARESSPPSKRTASSEFMLTPLPFSTHT